MPSDEMVINTREEWQALLSRGAVVVSETKYVKIFLLNGELWRAMPQWRRAWRMKGDWDEFIEGNKRTAIHEGQPSQRAYSPNHDAVGLRGERKFADVYGYDVNLDHHPHGDKGYDFLTPAGSVDIKAARKPWNLLVEAGKPPHAHIYVLAWYKDEGNIAELLGWEYESEMLKCPKKTFGYDILSHYKPQGELHRMDDPPPGGFHKSGFERK
jgi:hypothetical protein